MNVPDLIPLFPLAQPLFPWVPLRLQIFEPRYLRLVRESLRHDKPFGIVPIRRGREVGEPAEPCDWGTLVTIRDWGQLPNGLLSITVQGEHRLRVGVTRVEDDGLILGEVELLPADPLEPLSEEDADLLQLLNEFAEQLEQPELAGSGTISVAELGWRLMWLLPFDLRWRQIQFEEDDPEQRLLAIRRQLIALSRQ